MRCSLPALTRIFAIACGYPDGNDLDYRNACLVAISKHHSLRSDPAFKLACGRLPEAGTDLCSQAIISRWENTPALKEIIRLTYALIDIWCQSYARPPAAVTLDIDDTPDIVHGHQKLAEWNAHHDERCFLPIHIYDTATGRPVAMILRPGKTPSGKEVRGWLRRELDEVTLAFATSIHKAQGSEYPAVVIVGQRRAAAIGVRNTRGRHRWSS